DGAIDWASWDVSEFDDRQARIRVVDNATGGWGALALDHVVVGDDLAKPRSSETSVNLIVNGKVVRTSTGSNSEHLDWASWNVKEFAGQQASVRIVDNNRGGWGHILADQVTFSDGPARTALEGYDWLDWGRDYYAAVSYFGTPSGSRIMQGWMNNWDYANDIPTSTWRSSMSLPREVTLVSTPDGPRLRQEVVEQVDGQLQENAAQSRTGVALDDAVDLSLTGDVVRIDAVLRPGNAKQAGITVFGDAVSGTRIGYDNETGRIFVDRSNSGNVGFNVGFASVEDAPVRLDNDGTITLELYLDRASVELFTDDGRLTITDQVFPNQGADVITAWASGSGAVLESIKVTPLTPTMWKVPASPTGELTVASEISAGRPLAVDGIGFAAHEPVSLQLDGTELGRVSADEDGRLGTTVTIPVATAIGEHTLSAVVGGIIIDEAKVVVTPATFDVDVMTSPRCMAGKVTVTVQVVNPDSMPLTVTLTGAFGAKTLSVAPGKTVSAAFTTRLGAIPGGEMAVAATGELDGQLVTVHTTASVSPRSC
ncbi:MAG: GH32 C-terminal domain-containing protein, partial [Microbacterium sp.]|uniref:glycoside hydrolase family 32 protein n=1 Tax=Microbacterium sp. TaxID=51671 RepID=UPI003BB1622A